MFTYYETSCFIDSNNYVYLFSPVLFCKSYHYTLLRIRRKSQYLPVIEIPSQGNNTYTFRSVYGCL